MASRLVGRIGGPSPDKGVPKEFAEKLACVVMLVKQIVVGDEEILKVVRVAND